ncbi:MAG: hypothetical protein AB7V18_20690 [Pyrinomonadaceae bacterium]
MSKSILRLNRRRRSARTNPQFTMSLNRRPRCADDELVSQCELEELVEPDGIEPTT